MKLTKLGFYKVRFYYDTSKIIQITPFSPSLHDSRGDGWHR
ncbi:hypothetical protein [Moraxella lacunata]